MQRFTIDLPPDALRRTAPNWIWITMAGALGVPIGAGGWILFRALGPNAAFMMAGVLCFTIGSIAKEGWPRFFPTAVCIGDDGLHVAWRWGKTFIPITAIRSVAAEDNDVVVTLVSGERCVLASLSAEASPRDAIRAAIATALARRDARPFASDLAPRLARGGRTVDAWLAAVRANAKSSAYRGTGIPRDELLRIAEDASALPSARVGATIALGRLVDEERARLRVAADASAAPAVREAFQLTASAKGGGSGESDPGSTAEDRDETEALARAIEEILARETCE